MSRKGNFALLELWKKTLLSKNEPPSLTFYSRVLVNELITKTVHRVVNDSKEEQLGKFNTWGVNSATGTTLRPQVNAKQFKEKHARQECQHARNSLPCN